MTGVHTMPGMSELNMTAAINPQDIFDPFQLGETTQPQHAARLEALLAMLSHDTSTSATSFTRVMRDAMQYQLVGDYTHAFHALVQATYLIPKGTSVQPVEEEV